MKPSTEHLSSFEEALIRGWSPGGEPDAGARVLRQIRSDAAAWLATLDDREAKGEPISMPDGSTVPRLPGFEMWMWDGSFCGRITLRWRPGSTALPPTCLGYIGYAVVPWREGQGYATAALGQLLPLARQVGLPWVEVVTDPDNIASQRVIERNAGILIGLFEKPKSYGGSQSALRFQIVLGESHRGCG